MNPTRKGTKTKNAQIYFSVEKNLTVIYSTIFHVHGSRLEVEIFEFSTRNKNVLVSSIATGQPEICSISSHVHLKLNVFQLFVLKILHNSTERRDQVIIQFLHIKFEEK